MDRSLQFGYEAEPVRCHACAAVARAKKKFEEQPHDSGGLTWRIDKVAEVGDG